MDTVLRQLIREARAAAYRAGVQEQKWHRTNTVAHAEYHQHVQKLVNYLDEHNL
jgi:hypothetical protein